MTALLLLALGLSVQAADGGVPRQALRGKKVVVTSDTLEVLAKHNRAVYRGHVTATRDTTVIRSETMTVFYLPGAQDISRLQAEGQVEITDGDRWARGDQADYDNATGVLVVTGNVLASRRIAFSYGPKGEVLVRHGLAREARVVLDPKPEDAPGNKVEVESGLPPAAEAKK